VIASKVSKRSELIFIPQPSVNLESKSQRRHAVMNARKIENGLYIRAAIQQTIANAEMHTRRDVIGDLRRSVERVALRCTQACKIKDEMRTFDKRQKRRKLWSEITHNYFVGTQSLARGRIGLPLTLGFCAEDLLLHGTLETHPQFGIVLPMVTALNAFHILRLFTWLFWGSLVAAARPIKDALPRERWALTLVLLLLLIGGIQPNLFVQAPSAAAQKIVALFELPRHMAQK
jgi:hypothetical protein